MRLFCLLVVPLLLGWAVPVSLHAQDDAVAQLANAYFLDGEYEKAIELYTKLLRKQPDNAAHTTRLVDSHLALKDADAALAYLDGVLKRQKQAPQLLGLRGKVLLAKGDRAAAEATWKQAVDSPRDAAQTSLLGNFFVMEREYGWAEQTYLAARTRQKDPNAYANELSYIYRYLNDHTRVVKELVRLHQSNPAMSSYARSQILGMVHPAANEGLEAGLLQSIMAHPQDRELSLWLYDFYLQSENFAEALRQGRALDKQLGEGGKRLFALAQTLQQAGAYSYSNDALATLLEQPTSAYYVPALSQQAKNFELLAFEKRPLDTAALRQAVVNYDLLLKRYGRTPQMQEVMYRKARLCALYLQAPQQALAELEAIEALPVAPVQKAEARLLLGDVLLIRGEAVQARLQYQQVVEAFKEDQIGAQARFRTARLDYFLGNFEDAKGYLKVLKENTTNDIANDAIRLYLTIQDNLGLDSNTYALQRFAHAELLRYQGNTQGALALMDSIMQALPMHELSDDILYNKALIFLDNGETTRGLDLLERVIVDFGQGIYADDALFTKAEHYHYKAKQPEVALKLYMQLLIDYPASLLKVEARKRIRQLRGEKVG